MHFNNEDPTMHFSKCKTHTVSISLALLVFVLSGCASTIETFSDHDDEVDFSVYETFAWIDEHPMVSAPDVAAAANPFMESRIQDAIRRELSLRGYRYVQTADTADLVVSFSVGGRKDLSVESYPVAYRHRWTWGGAYIGDSVSVESTTEGVLAIDVFDAETRSPVWHGTARKSLTAAEANLRGSVIQDAVAAILTEFPPPHD